MTTRVQEIIDGIIGVEGRYSNNPNDAGGETCWGITEKVARANGYEGLMREMPREFAAKLLTNRYWFEPGFDKIADVSVPIAEELCDTGVNMGPTVAAKMLQRALNVLNRQAKDYPDVDVDGQIGPQTVRVLALFLVKRGARGAVVLLKLLNCLQGYRYVEITEGRVANEDFIYGWLDNRVAI